MWRKLLGITLIVLVFARGDVVRPISDDGKTRQERCLRDIDAALKKYDCEIEIVIVPVTHEKVQ